MSGTAFYDFMQTVTWGKKTTVEMCTNSLACFFGLSGKVKVDLEVSQDSYKVDPRAVDPNGVLLVRAANKGPDATSHYNFRPGYIYALVAYPDSLTDTTSHWVLKETDATTHHTVTVAAIHGPYSPCWDYAPAQTDDVGLYKCGEKHVSAAAVKRSAIGFFGLIDQLVAVLADGLEFESPIWKSCPSGCCTLDQPS